jgi:putative integral membrane protein (TIGR02587 family)
MQRQRPAAPPVRESLAEYGRGLAGGLLFSLPLVYTMEMWWAGFIAAPARLLALLLFTYVLLLGYNRFAGMHHDASWADVAIDSVEELGLGVLTGAAVLYLIGRIGVHQSMDEMLGTIVVEAAVVAIGFSVGTAQLKGGGDAESDHRPKPHFAGEVVIAFCGAVLFSANVAPTEEILIIAAEADPWRLAVLVLVSIAIGSIVLYFSGFRQSGRHHHGGTTAIVSGTVMTYAVSLLAGAVMLWFFGRFEAMSLLMIVSQTVVLAFPATLGASAGRLLLAS